MTRYHGRIEKGWGHEFIWATTDHYCGKMLHFNKGARCSMHFHAQKDETWYVLSGDFMVRWIDTDTAKQHEQVLTRGDVWHNAPLVPHQLICYAAGTIIEVSTADSAEDNLRVLPGDSQV